MIEIRKRIKSPFPTNYLKPLTLKISALLRYYEAKNHTKKISRLERREREIEVSKHGTLQEFFNEHIEFYRKKARAEGKPYYLLFKIHPKFESVLSKSVKLISAQDYVKVLEINENYEKLGEEVFRLVYVKIKE